jgi:hypothetical protein
MIALHTKYTSALLSRKRSGSAEDIVTFLEDQLELHRLMELLMFRE